MPPLTWRDRHGVVHIVIDDIQSEYDPPYALMLVCRIDVTWLNGRDDGRFGHVLSAEIRVADQREPATCLGCATYCVPI